ncbi:MAG: SMUG2 DNA glycosylase family protein [Dysgonamonadaceae bacterium]|nr:SMUG2 DNA glycosylase family protein [Dysgonamonadaceae bacterium]
MTLRNLKNKQIIMPKSFGDKVINFNRNLHYPGKLPAGFQVINPFQENPETMEITQQFYHKFYSDSKKRKFIVGINPSRHGAGVTGVPFTDTKRLESICGIKMHSAYTHEVSSVFMYEMIAQFGGARTFYEQFYINSPFPLAIVRKAKGGKWLNANYYDDPLLFEALKDYMIMTLKEHINLGLDTSEVFVLGVKNGQFIHKLNKETKLFESLKILEHPRYIQQYKFKEKQTYIDKYILTLNNLL